jgi:uridylate kinase
MNKRGKKIIVMSLGGSLIIPENVDTDYLRKFKKVIMKNIKHFKFVIVCGGGSTARKYISALEGEGKSHYIQSLAGISATRMNARFMSYFFGFDPEKGIAHDMHNVKNLLKTRDIVFCGALRYAPNQTSDATAVKLCAFLKTDFINLTNVKGLYNSNPLDNKNAKFIPKATISEFNRIVLSIPNKPGMHAPVDHTAMKVIREHKIRTYILGKDTLQLDNLLNNKSFEGTTIG